MEIVKVCNLFDYELYNVELSLINDGVQSSEDFKRKLVAQINVGDISDGRLRILLMYKV